MTNELWPPVNHIVLELAENSESEGRIAAPADHTDGGEGDATAGELKEYIIVDEEDVSHTTVEMYTSGIYTQVCLDIHTITMKACSIKLTLSLLNEYLDPNSFGAESIK